MIENVKEFKGILYNRWIGRRLTPNILVPQVKHSNKQELKGYGYDIISDSTWYLSNQENVYRAIN